MKVSVIIPFYNEEENIEPLVQELVSIESPGNTFEVILVDDGSSDSTWDLISVAAKEYAGVRGLRCERNQGQTSAMMHGLTAAQGEVMVTLDGDLQNDPADIPQLVEALDGVDAVCGYRAKRQDSWSRKVGSRMANKVRNWVTKDGIRDTGCSLKAFRSVCRDDLPFIEGIHRFMPAYFQLNGRTIRQIPVNHRSRIHGVSKYTNLKRLPRTIFDLVGFTWYRKRFLKRLNTTEA